MQVTSQEINDTLVISLAGELDEHSANYVRDLMDNLMSKSNARQVIVDLGQLDFMDSTGIGVMIGRYKKMKSRGIPIFVTNPSKQIDKIFMMTALYDVMPKID
mgnify:CR=1 FL=1